MSNTSERQTAAALKWLYEMEMIDSPILRTNLIENIFLSDKAIKDCGVFVLPTFTYQKGVLVYVKLGIFARTLRKDQIYQKVKMVVNELLPSYNVRVVDDYSILELSKEKIKETYGGKNEHNKGTDPSSVHANPGESSEISDSMRTASDLLPDREKPKKRELADKREISDGAKQSDLQIQQEVQNIVDDLYGDSDAGE